MGITDWFRKRRDGKIPPREGARERIVELLEPTRRPYVRVAFEPAATPLAPTASKLGGTPYVPVGVEPPRRPMMFLAQIDLAEVPALDPLPRTGLVQLWIRDDDTYGLFDDPQNGFRVIYYASLDRTARADISAVPPSGPLVAPTECRMTFEAKTEVLPIGDYLFDAFEARQTDPHLEWYTSGDISFDDSLGHKIGGYCAFTQDDPRSLDDPMFSLLQLDSDEFTFWGDTGIAHWFVREADLRAADFSRTTYYWDCC
jgi:uncharacterized protein YwqG